MAPSSTAGSSSTGVPVTRCPVLFNGTNYRDWVPRMRIHMHGLRLWEFLTSELTCPSCPTAPPCPELPQKLVSPVEPTAEDDAKLKKSFEAYDATVEKLCANYDDIMTSFEF